jgi:hypothetical protein
MILIYLIKKYSSSSKVLIETSNDIFSKPSTSDSNFRRPTINPEKEVNVNFLNKK